MTSRAKLFHTRFRIGSGDFRPKDMEALSLWENVPNIHRSQESQVYSQSEGFEFTTKEMGGVAEGLRLYDRIPPR